MSKENRGRPKEVKQEVKEKWVREYHEYPGKPELGSTTMWHHDNKKTKRGAFKVETTYPKGYKHDKVKVDKGKAYSGAPVVLVFKTSNRSNAKYKMKVWKNESIDYIMSAKKLSGVPETAVIMDVAVGKSYITSYKLKYKL
jgi:hypothetical protein